jgi:hypothetical protein
MAQYTSFAEKQIGTLSDLLVNIIKDEEFADRFYLRGAAAHGMIDVTIIDPIARDLAEAAEQLVAEMAAC